MNKPKLGIIQILSLGYESVVRAAWVLLIPVLLDIFFWLGPRLSIRTLFERLVVVLARNGPPGPEFQWSTNACSSSATIGPRSRTWVSRQYRSYNAPML